MEGNINNCLMTLMRLKLAVILRNHRVVVVLVILLVGRLLVLRVLDFLLVQLLERLELLERHVTDFRCEALLARVHDLVEFRVLADLVRIFFLLDDEESEALEKDVAGLDVENITGEHVGLVNFCRLNLHDVLQVVDFLVDDWKALAEHRRRVQQELQHVGSATDKILNRVDFLRQLFRVLQVHQLGEAFKQADCIALTKLKRPPVVDRRKDFLLRCYQQLRVLRDDESELVRAEAFRSEELVRLLPELRRVIVQLGRGFQNFIDVAQLTRDRRFC